jgi:hypothetical protein
MRSEAERAGVDLSMVVESASSRLALRRLATDDDVAAAIVSSARREPAALQVRRYSSTAAKSGTDRRARALPGCSPMRYATKQALGYRRRSWHAEAST